MRKCAAFFLAILLAAPAIVRAQDDYDSRPQRQHHKKKKFHSHRLKRPSQSSHWDQAAPRGVATSLPPKRTVGQATSSFAGTESPAEASYAVPVVTPNHLKSGGFHANLELVRGDLSSADTHLGTDRVTITRFIPRVLWDVNSSLSIYGQAPFSTYSPTQATDFDTIGRPELGTFMTVWEPENFKLGAGLAVKLPMYSFRGGDAEFVDPVRVWQFSPGIAWDDVFTQDEATHFLGAIKIAYDTNASFQFSDVNASTGMPETIDGLQRPLTIIATAGLSRDFGDLTMGLALHTYHWLSSGTLTSAGAPLRDVPGVALAHGEFFASYRFNQDTSANASVNRGFKTDADPSSFAVYDVPEEMANLSMSVGFTHVF